MRLTSLLLSCVLLLFCCANLFSQGAPLPPIPALATNNSGFIQNGPDGPDNLVFFNIVPIPDPDLVELLLEGQIDFAVLGDMTLGDINGDGADDSIGTFSGLEWSTGLPNVGTLIGCVLNEGAGNGEVYQLDPFTAVPTLIGIAPEHPETEEQLGFSDLAFNPTDGLMYGLTNDITDDGMGNVEYGPNILWVDTDGDLVPETSMGEEINTAGFCLGTLQTLASGLAFDAAGALYIYDSVAEQVLINPFGVNSSTLATPCVNPPPNPFVPIETGLTSSQLTHGSGLAVGRDLLLISTDTAQRDTWISFFQIPEDWFPLVEPDPIPEVFPSGYFEQVFFQSSFFARVAVGDLVSAAANLNELPTFFPDNIIVNHGTPAKDAILEAVAVSDDIYYCIFAAPPVEGGPPLSLDFVYTLPNPAGLTALGLEIELHGNTPNLFQVVQVMNVNTGEFDLVASGDVPLLIDEVITVDLSFTLENYVDPQSGTLTCRIQTFTNGLTLAFPWQVKYDSVLVIAD